MIGKVNLKFPIGWQVYNGEVQAEKIEKIAGVEVRLDCKLR